MTEVPGTDRDRARENVAEETPLVPGPAEGAGSAGDTAGDDDTDRQVKPEPGSTDLDV
jgi:hypothetical protein